MGCAPPLAHAGTFSPPTGRDVGMPVSDGFTTEQRLSPFSVTMLSLDMSRDGDDGRGHLTRAFFRTPCPQVNPPPRGVPGWAGAKQGKKTFEVWGVADPVTLRQDGHG